MSDESDGTATLDPTRPQPPPKVRRDFWLLVGLFNAALLSLALGGMLLAFADRGLVGGLLIGLGIGLLTVGLRRYRRRRKA